MIRKKNIYIYAKVQPVNLKLWMRKKKNFIIWYIGSFYLFK